MPKWAPKAKAVMPIVSIRMWIVAHRCNGHRISQGSFLSDRPDLTLFNQSLFWVCDKNFCILVVVDKMSCLVFTCHNFVFLKSFPFVLIALSTSFCAEKLPPDLSKWANVVQKHRNWMALNCISSWFNPMRPVFLKSKNLNFQICSLNP